MANNSNAVMPTIAESPWALETNILVYATAIDAPAEKQRIDQRLLEQLFFGPAGLHGRSGSERVAERSVAQKSDGPRLGA